MQMILISCTNVKKIKQAYQELKKKAVEIGQDINISKTKRIIMSPYKFNTDQCLHIGEHNTEFLNSFVYLGSCITYDNELSEIRRRLLLANNAAVMKSQMVQY
jgi:hypothetical protein